MNSFERKSRRFRYHRELRQVIVGLYKCSRIVVHSESLLVIVIAIV